MNNDELPLDKDDLNELIEHLQSDEQISLESTLASIGSFKHWVNSHPAMRQMLIVDNISDIVPAIWKFLRIMFGLDSEPVENTSIDPVDEGDQL